MTYVICYIITKLKIKGLYIESKVDINRYGSALFFSIYYIKGQVIVFKYIDFVMNFAKRSLFQFFFKSFQRLLNIN